MEFIIVTGLSGAGKSRAVDILEDIGFFCVDNMPPKLIPTFAQLILQSGEKRDRVAVVTDVRGGDMFGEIFVALEELKRLGCVYKILYIDADTPTIRRRYEETRRKHPLLDRSDGSIDEAIETEREILRPLRQIADYIIDSSQFTVGQFRERVSKLFLENPGELMKIHVNSFGFKYGIPSGSDLVFDVRCLPNPFYIPELKHQTGMDAPVRDYVMKFPQSQNLVPKLLGLIDYLVPLYRTEGKSQLTVSIGCTGGKHRSVTFAQLLADHFRDQGLPVSVTHRDINK